MLFLNRFKIGIHFLLMLLLSVTSQNCTEVNQLESRVKVRSVTLNGNGDAYDGKVYNSLEMCSNGNPKKQIVQPKDSSEFFATINNCSNVERSQVSVNATDPVKICTDLITHSGTAFFEQKTMKLK